MDVNWDDILLTIALVYSVVSTFIICRMCVSEQNLKDSFERKRAKSEKELFLKDELIKDMETKIKILENQCAMINPVSVYTNMKDCHVRCKRIFPRNMQDNAEFSEWFSNAAVADGTKALMDEMVRSGAVKIDVHSEPSVSNPDELIYIYDFRAICNTNWR